MQTSLPFEQESRKSRGKFIRPALGASSFPAQHTDDQQAVSKAERVLLDLADYIYAHTPLKPMSKTLFLISRCLLVARKNQYVASSRDFERSYRELCSSLGSHAPRDDFDFQAVLAECGDRLPHILDAVTKVARLTAGADSLGLAFNTLLRGKFESGEGLGTFLTPEEVVNPMVRMLLGAVDPEVLRRVTSDGDLLFGDICGGTGRFVYALYRFLHEYGLSLRRAEQTTRLFDQSSLAVEFGRLNFLFDDLTPRFSCVSDSLTARSISKLRGSFALLATNPPFGTGKYRWSTELSEALSSELLRTLGMRGPNDVADPSELFLFRNLDLLAPGGALAIILPDGVIQSRRFLTALHAYENLQGVSLCVAALVSLPVVTFSLGGTVAKTSFLIFRKSRSESMPLYVAIARHVGFVKRGNRRLPDAQGNDLLGIANDFLSDTVVLGVRLDSWQSLDRLVPTAICHTDGVGQRGMQRSPRMKLKVIAPDLSFPSFPIPLCRHRTKYVVPARPHTPHPASRLIVSASGIPENEKDVGDVIKGRNIGGFLSSGSFSTRGDGSVETRRVDCAPAVGSLYIRTVSQIRAFPSSAPLLAS